MVDSIFPMIQGVEYGLLSAEVKRLENSVRAGENNYLTAILQICQGSKALDFADKAGAAAGLPFFSWVGKSLIYLTPVLLAAVKNTTMVPEKIRPVVTFLQHHLGTLYQIAAAVSSLSLLFFGQTFFAISSLSILGIGVMDRNGWLPLTVRQFLHRYSQPLLVVTGLVSGGLLDRTFAALSALSWCANTYLSHKNHLREGFALQENLTPQKVTDFLGGRLNVKVNPRFIHYNPFPPIPNIDIQFFIEKFDQINWEKHLPALRRKLRDDARFIAQHGTPDLKTDQEIIDITRHTLETCIKAVKERRILEGEPVDYEKLHNYLKLIAKHLEGQNDEIIGTDMIFRVAVEGGEYCGPGKFEMAESVYAQTIGDHPDIPFRDKIVYCLQDERNLWMQTFYSIAFTQSAAVSLAAEVIDWQDVHNYNLFVNLYGDEFGLRKAGADNDDTALIDPLIKWVISNTLKETIHRIFWNDHSLNDHTQILIDSIGTPQLPKPEVYAFWQNWIERQQMEEPNKTALREELAHGRLYDKPLEIDGRFTPEFVTLMLLDIGIVEIGSQDLPILARPRSLEPVRV